MEENKIMLNDILNFTEEEIKNAKITLNMTAGHDGKSFLDYWLETNDLKNAQKHCYWSHGGEKEENNRNFTREGQINVGFVRMNENDKWLLVTIGKITKIPQKPDHCEFEEYKEKYIGLYGRLIIRCKKGNTFARYCFNLSTFLDNCEVLEILPKRYEGEEFKGFDQISLKYDELKDMLAEKSRKTWKEALSQIKGVYCLTDKKTGKLYIGSATGENGFSQRWNDYLKTKTGGNVELIKLYEKEGEQYFIDNFQYTVLEWFGLNYDNKKILERENYWKNAFSTREGNGYNKN